MAEQFTLQKGAPVPIAPGITVTLNGVNVPQTGATTALVTVSHMKQRGTVEGKIEVLHLAVESIKTDVLGAMKTWPSSMGSPDIVPILSELTTVKDMISGLSGQLTADDTTVVNAADALKAALKEFEDRFDQIDTALRLLVDE